MLQLRICPRCRDTQQVDSIATLLLDSFPVIDDFSIELRQTVPKFGNHLFFVSAANGDLISFPWWDHVERDLQRWTQRNIPLGTKDKPFYDLEQGWQVVIFEERPWVYVLQGGGSEDRRSVFHT